MSGDVTLGFAFLAGLISFISPCVLPLVPAYVGYMGGQLTRQVSGGTAAVAAPSRFRTFTHGLSFVLGFTAFFVIFGLLTTAAISSLEAIGVSDAQVTDAIARIGGTAVILFGLHIMGVLPRVLTWLHRQALQLDRNPYGNLISVVAGIAAIGAIYWLFIESWFMTLVVVLLLAMVFRPALKTDTAGQFWGAIINQAHLALYADTRRQNSLTARYGYSGSFLMGIVFSAGWTPCIGPIYGAVLTQAALGGSIARAGTQLTAYSLGLGIPFLLTALALDQAQGLFRRLQRNMRTVELLSGAFLILIGVLIFSGQLERLTQVGGNQGALADVPKKTISNIVCGNAARPARAVPSCPLYWLSTVTSCRASSIAIRRSRKARTTSIFVRRWRVIALVETTLGPSASASGRISWSIRRSSTAAPLS
jgi:cytochrome c-type biogenesis protein